MGLTEALRAKRSARGGSPDVTMAATSIELERDDFMRWLEGPLRGALGERGGFALLVINLRRSDRTAALLRRPLSRACDAEAARRVSDALRPQDRFTRLGPEHLLVVLPRIGDVAVVTLAVNRLLSSFEAPIEIGHEKFRMRPCMGCALWTPEQSIDVEKLLGAADAACALAASSESAFAVASAESIRPDDAEEMLGDFQAALRANELEVWFQPQRHVASGACIAAEALMRWRNKRLDRMVAPPLMVDIAEKHGMMSALTTFILNTALRQLSDLRRAGIDLRIAVNASPSLLRDTELPELVERALGTWSIPPDRLTLEVTESAIMVDVEQSLRVLHRLKEQQVRLAIDDFGTGYSSLAYLQRMPLDELKIDKTFVRNMLENKADEQIVRSVIDLAHNFELEAVAEGVETPATFEALARLGCDVIQGYVYAYPMPPREIPGWWAARER